LNKKGQLTATASPAQPRRPEILWLATAYELYGGLRWRLGGLWCGRFENFEPDHQYESNHESEVRFELESNLEASQVSKTGIPYVNAQTKIMRKKLL